MKKWRCTICGEIVESDVRPDLCPLCKAPGEKFVEVVEEGMTWAAEHEVGVGKAEGVPMEIISRSRDAAGFDELGRREMRDLVTIENLLRKWIFN